MMKKRLLSGLLISAMAVLMAATPVLAVEADTEGEYPETLSSDPVIDELPDGDGSETSNAETVVTGDAVSANTDINESVSEGEGSDEYVSEETVSDEIAAEDDLPAEPAGDVDNGEDYSLSVMANTSAGDNAADNPDEEAVSDGDEDIDPDEYGIATLATTADPVLEDGFYQDPDSGDWYYYTDGQIDTDMNSVIKDTEKRISETAEWWYVVGGKVQMDFTGLADYSNASGWWYITNGCVDRTYNGLAENKNGMWYVTAGKLDRTYNGLAKYQNVWWYVVNGKVDTTYTGFAVNDSGSWYMENGKLTRTANSVFKDTTGVLGSKGEWYYVVGSKVQYDFTGLADYSNASGWWYITNGRVDRTYNGLAKNKNGWYYLTSGKVNRSYTGFAVNENGSWYITNGKLTRKDNTVIKDSAGVLGTKGEWYYVVGSKVQYGFTGLADYSNSSGWWYITNGVVDRTVNTVAKNKNGWYYVLSGKVQKNFTGLADYKNASGWWYITNGKVDRTFTGVAENKNGAYYIKDGKVQQSFTGTVTIGEDTYSVVNGKVTLVEPDAENNENESADGHEFTLSPEDINYAGRDTTQLEAPVFSGVVDGKNGTMTLTWDPVPGAEKYRVFIREYGDSSWTKLGDTTATSYTDYRWNESKVYYYTVRCVSADGSEYMSDFISGFSGSAVAAFAQQFVGNPYVYGGTSLTNGCDCSGFVMQVYAHFGVYLPHQSGVQITLGQSVGSINDAQPGDIVGRSGHTMIYIGNGQVVHAQDSQHGITISDVSKTNYTNIRRIF